MKTNMKNTFKPLAIAITFALGSVTLGTAANTVFAEVTTDIYNNARWQSPLAVEFAALDSTGNGLLLPNEASKGKAFNKTTFAKADANRDGYIDQDEYVYFKTGAWPVVAKQNVDVNEASSTDSAQAVPTNEGDAMVVAESPETEKRTVGDVIDDSIITAKAKAEILGTTDLKSLQISVETRDGEVILSGFVDNAAAKMKAEEVVSKVEGVKSVKNGLEVRS